MKEAMSSLFLSIFIIFISRVNLTFRREFLRLTKQRDHPRDNSVVLLLKDSYNGKMYKILIETQFIPNSRQTPFRKIADPHSQLKETPLQTQPIPLFPPVQIKGRIHLYKDYHTEEQEDLGISNLTANKIDIKTQALFINRLPRQRLEEMVQALRERRQLMDSLDVVAEVDDERQVSLIVGFSSVLASEEVYQLTLCHFHVLPLYLREATLALLPPTQDRNRHCLAIVNPHLQSSFNFDTFVQQQRWVELPRCLDCLERLQYDLTGISAQVFSQLGKNRRSLPCQTCLTLNASQPTICALCGSSEDNWICMVCSRIGCGRYKNRDAFKHFTGEGHIITMDLETQRVWNYLADCFSHRVIPLQKQEVTLKFPEVTHRSERYEQSLQAAFWEYCSVVSEELERQRAFYQRQRNEQEQRFRKEAARLQEMTAEARAELQRKSESLRKVNKRNKKLEKRVEEVRDSCKIEREILANYEQTMREEGKEETMAEVEARSDKIQEKLKILQGIDSQIESILSKLTQ